MIYTVHEVAMLSGVTIKTLYHYHKINLLQPKTIADNGYRLYGNKELEQLQQILFFRELGFPLKKIKIAMENEPSRIRCLQEQKSLLAARKQKMEQILQTLEDAIQCTEKGVIMSKETMFKGLNKQEWKEHLSSQNQYLQETYDAEIDINNIDTDDLNEKAREATAFITFMADALRNNVSINSQPIIKELKRHINFLKKDMDIDAKGFAAQARFLMNDDFHRQMLEEQQIGLSYYICMAADNYAEILK